MQCADMRGQPIRIQNAGRVNSRGYGWNFVIDTCEQLSAYTGDTNCKPDAEVRAMMNEFIVTTKTGTQFFSEKTFINNDYKMDTQFVSERFVLSNSIAMFNHFTVERVTNYFSNRVYYNDQLFRDIGAGSDQLLTYNAKPDLAKVYPYTDIKKSLDEYAKHNAPIYAPLTVHFS